MDKFGEVSVGFAVLLLVLMLSLLCKQSKTIARLIEITSYTAVAIGLLFYFVYLIDRFYTVVNKLDESGISLSKKIDIILSHGTTYTEFATFATLLGLIALFDQNKKKNRIGQKTDKQKELIQKQKILELEKEIKRLRSSDIKELESTPITMAKENQVILDARVKDKKTSNMMVGFITISLIAIVLKKVVTNIKGRNGTV